MILPTLMPLRHQRLLNPQAIRTFWDQYPQ